jgi:hypothetical protein
MPDVNTTLSTLTVVLLAIGGYLLYLLRTGTEAAIKTSAEEAAKATIQQLRWPAELAQELQKTRGVERQELRFKSYGSLWKELRPLAVYDATPISRSVVGSMSSKLSDWYFSESGGLLLTPQARDFYFALQDLLRATSKFSEEWDADRSEESVGNQQEVFRDVLSNNSAKEGNKVLDYFSDSNFEDWHIEAIKQGKMWRASVNQVAASWSKLDARQRFATLQQVGSILRTCLVNDLESRLR